MTGGVGTNTSGKIESTQSFLSPINGNDLSDSVGEVNPAITRLRFGSELTQFTTTLPDNAERALEPHESKTKTPCLPRSVSLTHPMSALNSTILNSVVGEDNRLVAGAVGAVAVLATTAAYYALGSKDEEHGFPKLRGIQLYHAWKFFQRRYDFLHSNFKQNFGKGFSFNVLHHNIVALTGEEARQAFYSNPHLDFNEGYKLLMGAVRVSPTSSNRAFY